MKFYRVIVNKTAKTPYKKEDYQMFDSEKKEFETLDEVKEYLSQYKGLKREKMYIDTKNGTSKHVGCIYTFRNSDISHNSEEWLERDWVEVQEVDEYFKRIFI